MNHSFYKLQVLDKLPKDFKGKVFSFSENLGGQYINLDDDPFLNVKKAVSSGIGTPCVLLREGSCFFSELFISLYEQLSFTHLEIKNYFKSQTKAFLGKKEQKFFHVKFENPSEIKTIIVGKSSTLVQEIELIKRHQDHCLVVAAYSALPFLSEHGICCDLAFAFDPEQQCHGFKNAKTLVVAPKTSGDILDGFETLALFPESFCGYSNYLYWDHPHPPIYGYTVIDTCLKFLIQSGLKEFYLSGVSLEEQGGYYVDKGECGYKPDFKKAKEHIESLEQVHGGIYQLSRLNSCEDLSKKNAIALEHFPIEQKVLAFEKSFQEALSLKLDSLGLYEMFMLEQSPFYQIVLEPLYNKWMILQCDESLDKRDFFQSVLTQYAKDFL